MKVAFDISRLSPPPVDSISGLLEELKRKGPPAFSKHTPDVERISKAAKELARKRHLIVIGQGGSITTLKGLRVLASLKGVKAPEVHIVDTVDPAFIGSVLRKAPPKESHVVVVSKAGSTLTVLEAMSAFTEYGTTVMVQEGSSPLREMAERKGYRIIDLPKGVPGRFSGGAEGTLLPAAAIGIDIKGFREGMVEAYTDALGKEDVLGLCGALYLKERLGYRNLFIPIYSKGLSGFTDLAAQLFHETLGKDRKGLTVLCSEGPECQHHTLQRVLDGPEDIMTLFITAKGAKDLQVDWGEGAGDICFKETCLKDLSEYSLEKALASEYHGLMASMDELEMPWVKLELHEVDDGTAGYFVGTLHFIAYYSALLRKVDPFDQPAVERSKEISCQMRLKK